MRKVRPAIAILLVIVVLLVASGIVASLAKWGDQWMLTKKQTSNVNLLVVLVTVGTAAASIGAVLVGRWKWRRPKRRREKASRTIAPGTSGSAREESSECTK